MKRIKIDGNSLRIEDIYNVCFNDYKIDFPEDSVFFDKIQKSRDFLENYLKKGYPVYGVTTGFGDSCDNQINAEKTEKLQHSLVSFHGIGVGNYFSKEEAKAVTLVRLNSNIKGYSAIRIDLANLMKEFVNRNIAPCIPEIGSVGASGDLTPLSYLAATLMGERKVYYKDKIEDANSVLKSEKLTPIKLQAKEGLALMNGTSVMTAIASLAWYQIKKLVNISDFITGVTVEILKGNEIPYRDKVSEIKNHAGQLQSARYITKVISDSKRVVHYEKLLDKIGSIENKHYKKHNIKIQDRYSLRCSPQINGVVRDTLSFTKLWIENEINSSNDNPLIDYENDVIYNSGNFYGGHVCAACDYMRTALANIADLSDKQAELIIDAKFNNLTENLIPRMEETSENSGLFHGFKAAQISISALCSEINFLSNPVSIHSRPTEALNQDKVSLGTISARKLREVVDLLFYQYSIHLLAVMQAVDIIGVEHFGSFTKNIYNELRKFTKFVFEDRPLEDEARMVFNYLKNSNLFIED
ncbi:MAG TPA: aromatic amino acid ammonia-lyase [Spirochaetota bacterium]|nr:aromatic amino acid ammonia-lyase [Spirochaetota bacterium]